MKNKKQEEVREILDMVENIMGEFFDEEREGSPKAVFCSECGVYLLEKKANLSIEVGDGGMKAKAYCTRCK